ncbi:MAG TPA: hypothetical protein DCR40_16440 [Prolixibacteraceae bacterium]|nr:hypothetical protein [Prolixibacteraceae bacterium]
MVNRPIMKALKLFRILLLFTVFLIVESGCKVFQHHRRSTGVIINTEPHGRLAAGEIDNMSGERNGMPAKKKEKDSERNKEPIVKSKKSAEKTRKPFEPRHKKKYKRR